MTNTTSGKPTEKTRIAFRVNGVKITVPVRLTFMLGQQTCEKYNPRLRFLCLRMYSAVSMSLRLRFPFQLESLRGFLATTSDSLSPLLLLSSHVSMNLVMTLVLKTSAEYASMSVSI